MLSKLIMILILLELPDSSKSSTHVPEAELNQRFDKLTYKTTQEASRQIQLSYYFIRTLVCNKTPSSDVIVGSVLIG